jgi:hypothetical protein
MKNDNLNYFFGDHKKYLRNISKKTLDLLKTLVHVSYQCLIINRMIAKAYCGDVFIMFSDLYYIANKNI